MEQLIADYHGEMQKLHPIQRAAIFHLRFEAIHPFIDGNGRTGRLLMNLELMKDGFPPIDIKFQDRQRYIDCFKTWQNGDYDSTKMEVLAAGYMKSSLEEYIHILDIANRIRPGGDGPDPEQGPVLTI